jgi:outer membrane lipopolysaccharide assembly protein LptE/RlpB
MKLRNIPVLLPDPKIDPNGANVLRDYYDKELEIDEEMVAKEMYKGMVSGVIHQIDISSIAQAISDACPIRVNEELK